MGTCLRILLFLLAFYGTPPSRASESLSAQTSRYPPQLAIVAQASPEAAENETSDSEASEETDIDQLPQLSLGSSGEAVERLQRQLQATGFYNGEITGSYDLATDLAVSNFQENQGLNVDGTVGPTTWERLNALQPQTPPPSETERDEADRENTSAEATSEPEPSGLGLMWWLAGLVGALLLGGGLFFILTRVFHEDFDPELDPDAEPALEPSAEVPSDTASTLEAIPEAAIADTSEPPPDFSPAPLEEANTGLSEVEPHPEPSATVTASEPEPQAFPEPPAVVSSNGSQGESFEKEKEEVKTQANPSPKTTPPPAPAVESLTRLPRMSIVEALILDLQHPNPERRHKAIWELGQRGDSRAIGPLVDLLVESDSQERSTILAVLSEIGTRTLRPMKQALMISLQDDSAEVRKNAIRDLTRIYDSLAQLSQVLSYGTDDSDPEVRETARWAMSQMHRIRVLPPGEANRDSSDR